MKSKQLNNVGKEETKTVNTRLSYSSMSELLSCEQKFWHRKINNTPADSDYVESDALGLGKAFHQVLENTLHLDYNDKLILEAMEEHKVDMSEKALLTVMLDKYVNFRKKSGYKVVKCELAITTHDYTGYIDFIAIKGDKFYIGDLKTAARFDENKIPRLALDPQLNLYASFADDIKNLVDQVGGREFGGCLYLQTTKSKAGTQSGLEKGVKVYETLVPAEVMDPKAMWSIFKDAYLRSLELRAGEVPKKNYGACFNYFSFCQHFSKCHGDLASKAANRVVVRTIEDLESEELL